MQKKLNTVSLLLSIDKECVCSFAKLFQYNIKYLYSYFSIVYQNCIVNLGRPSNGVKLFQYTINNLYSNSRIGHEMGKALKSM